jgi:hypothetical protein
MNSCSNLKAKNKHDKDIQMNNDVVVVVKLGFIALPVFLFMSKYLTFGRIQNKRPDYYNIMICILNGKQAIE